MKDNKDEDLKKEAPQEEKVQEEPKDKVKEEAKKEKVDPREAKIAELTKEVATWKDKAYRVMADADNLRKSYEKDHQNLVKYRGQPFVEKLLPTLDNFYLVLKPEQTDPMLKNYLIGFNMIYTSMLNALNEEGVNQIIPKIGEDFNHNTMQAIDTQQGEEDDKVLVVQKPGYMLRDRLVRPAMVVVSKKVIQQEENKEASDEASQEKGE